MSVMFNRYRTWRRDRARDRVFDNGRELRRVEVTRTNLDGAVWPVDAQYLDSEIDRLNRLIEKDKTYLKETA